MPINYDARAIPASIRYLARDAPRSEGAQALAARAGLPLDGDPLAPGRGLVFYLYRLVVLGLDTEGNLRLLFGPNGLERAQERLLREQRVTAQGLVERNGQDAAGLGGFLNEGIPEGAKIDVRRMTRGEYQEGLTAMLAFSPAADSDDEDEEGL